MGSPVAVVGSEGGRADEGRPHWKGHNMPVAATTTPASGYRAVEFTSEGAAFAMSADDEVPGAVSEVTRAVFDRISGPKELVEVDGGHFGLLEYPSHAFDETSQAQAAWLARTLGNGASGSLPSRATGS